MLDESTAATTAAVVGVSACDTASFLQVIVDAVDTLVNECACDNEGQDGTTTVTFSSLEVKLEALLQDGVGGIPKVGIISSNSAERSVLDIDIELSWSFQEVSQLEIDLAQILDGLDLSGDIETFAKGLVCFLILFKVWCCCVGLVVANLLFCIFSVACI